ncbi:MAG: hypothetical protein ACTJG8_05465 [Canibacter sp.]
MANAAHTAAPAHTSTRVPSTGCWPASSAGTKIAELSQGDLLVTVSQVALPGPIDFEFSESTPEPVTDNVILLNYTYENTGDDSVWLTARSHQVDVFATDDTSVTKEDLSLGWFSLRYGSAPAYKAYVEQAGLNMYPLTEKGTATCRIGRRQASTSRAETRRKLRLRGDGNLERRTLALIPTQCFLPRSGRRPGVSSPERREVRSVSNRKLESAIFRHLGVLFIAGCLAVGMAGCGLGGVPQSEPTKEAKVEVTTSDWAPATDTSQGELRTSYELGTLQIDVYQVAVVPAPIASDDKNDDGTLVLDAGDDAVVFNVVYTNQGSPLDIAVESIGMHTSPTYVVDDQEVEKGSLANTDEVEDVFAGLGLNSSWYLPEAAEGAEKFVLGTNERVSKASMSNTNRTLTSTSRPACGHRKSR